MNTTPCPLLRRFPQRAVIILDERPTGLLPGVAAAWRKSLPGVLDGPATPVFWNIDKSE